MCLPRFALTLASCRWTRMVLGLLLMSALGFSSPARAQSAQDLVAYSDSLQNGWQDWSWAPRNLAQTTPVFSGTKSIEVDFGAWQALALHHDGFVSSAYGNLSFYVNGGASGGQSFKISALNAGGTVVGSVPVTNYVSGSVIPANQWVLVTIPLSDLHADTLLDLSAFWFQENTGTSQPPFYLDQITLTAPIPPASTSLTVNAAQVVQLVDRKIFGVNAAIWDGDLDTGSTKSLMLGAGTSSLRFPGGSASDVYDWTKQQYNGQSTTPQFGDLAATLGADAFITINYGTGTAQQAAAWVAYCNAAPANPAAIGVDANGRDWKTASYWALLRGSTPLSTDDGLNFLRVGHTAPYGFHNWEIGNECYGSWEADNHTPKQDGVIYANFAASAAALMKSVDPTIAVGAVVTAGEDDSGNQSETVTNPVTLKTHKGWTAVVLSTLSGIGYTPDFVIYHNYAQNAGGESDSVLLHSAALWPLYAVTLRTLLTQYLGTAASANVLLTSTENNSVSTSPGKQSVSLVNGLYYADSTGSILQTEFAANVWWDLHNGVGTDGNLGSALYGWRQYGDYGVLSTASGKPGATVVNTPYPAYFGMKIVSKFAHGGDRMVAASSSFTNLSVYAARQSGGALALLVINKDAANDLPATVTLNGFTAGPTATVFQYGKTQDTSQSLGNSVDLAQSTAATSGTSLAMTFPSYSVTVIVLPQAVTPPPTISPAAGLYNAAQSVMLSDTAPGAVIYYTLDGSAPTTGSSLYSAPIAVAQSETVTAMAVAPGSLPSASPAAAYVIDTVPPMTTASASGATVTLSASDALSGVASTFYALDGGAQAAYSAPFTVTGAGTHTVAYFSTDKAGNTENPHSVTVTLAAAKPTLTSLSPASAAAGSPAFTLTVNGANFVSSSIVKWNGASRTTRFVSASQLTASISAGDVAATGTVPVTVTTPKVATTAPLTFTVTVGVVKPVITSLNPTTKKAGTGAFTLTVTGTGFASNSIVKWNGAAQKTTFVSATQLTAAIPASLVKTAGAAPLTVTTPQVATSPAKPFTVTQ